MLVTLQIYLQLIDSHSNILCKGQVNLFEQEAVEGSPANKWPHFAIFREHFLQFDFNQPLLHLLDSSLFLLARKHSWRERFLYFALLQQIRFDVMKYFVGILELLPIFVELGVDRVN